MSCAKTDDRVIEALVQPIPYALVRELLRGVKSGRGFYGCGEPS